MGPVESNSGPLSKGAKPNSQRVGVYQKPNTSAPHPEHRVYPYLLRDLAIVRPTQVWCSDITYIPMRRGFLYLVAIMDWHSTDDLAAVAAALNARPRKTLGWKTPAEMLDQFLRSAQTGRVATTS